MNYTNAARLRYFSNFDNSNLLTKIKKEVDSNLKYLSREMQCIFHDILENEPGIYWNKKVYEEVFHGLNQLASVPGNQLDVNDEIFEHFLIGLHTYNQITDIIKDLGSLNDNPTIKNRLYRIPTYISIVEGCLTNLFRVIILLLDQTSSKNFAANRKLNPLCDILKSNGFDLAVQDVNINIRNAINHGGVQFRENGQEIEFSYTENRRIKITTLKTYEFDRLINSVYDAASAILLAITNYFNNNINIISIDMSEKLFTSFNFHCLRLSIPQFRITNISDIPNNKQINITVTVQNTDKNFLTERAFELAILIFEYYKDYENYMIFFSNERLMTSWIRFNNKEVVEISQMKRSFAEILVEISQRNDYIIFSPSDEKIDMQEIKYFRFPNIKTERFKINEIEDYSFETRKRLKAHLFIENIRDKDEIVSIFDEAVTLLNKVKNVPMPSIVIKSGDVESDSLYINVYRQDSRTNKELLPNNNNFVCFLDYNIDGITTLKQGGLPTMIWNNLYHEEIGNYRIAWREGKYIGYHNKVKIGRNDPCNCGSGKKSKKCCGK